MNTFLFLSTLFAPLILASLDLNYDVQEVEKGHPLSGSTPSRTTALALNQALATLKEGIMAHQEVRDAALGIRRNAQGGELDSEDDDSFLPKLLVAMESVDNPMDYLTKQDEELAKDLDRMIERKKHLDKLYQKSVNREKRDQLLTELKNGRLTEHALHHRDIGGAGTELYIPDTAAIAAQGMESTYARRMKKMGKGVEQLLEKARKKLEEQQEAEAEKQPSSRESSPEGQLVCPLPPAGCRTRDPFRDRQPSNNICVPIAFPLGADRPSSAQAPPSPHASSSQCRVPLPSKLKVPKKPGTSGSSRPSPSGSLMLTPSGSVMPSRAGSVMPSRAGSVMPSPAGSVMPSRAGSPELTTPSRSKTPNTARGLPSIVIKGPDSSLSGEAIGGL